MSSLDAVPTASAHIHVPGIVRETLHTGPIVRMKVPAGANGGSYVKDDEEIPFLQFCQNIRGGVVNFFVHTSDCRLLGKVVTATASVLQKTLQDGRQYLYVDLVPIADDTPVTHRLAVMNDIDGSWNNEDHLVFPTPEPLAGIIIFAPPGAKVVPAGTIAQKPVPIQAKAPSASDDTQLDRLLADGWEVDSEDSSRVRLFKMKRGTRRTMIHHRPRKKCR